MLFCIMVQLPNISLLFEVNPWLSVGHYTKIYQSEQGPDELKQTTCAPIPVLTELAQFTNKIMWIT